MSLNFHTHTLRVYQSRDGWRWTLQSTNGKIVADSGEAYARKRNAVLAAESLRKAVMLLKIDPTPPQKLVRVRGKFAAAKPMSKRP